MRLLLRVLCLAEYSYCTDTRIHTIAISQMARLPPRRESEWVSEWVSEEWEEAGFFSVRQMLAPSPQRKNRPPLPPQAEPPRVAPPLFPTPKPPAGGFCLWDRRGQWGGGGGEDARSRYLLPCEIERRVDFIFFFGNDKIWIFLALTGGGGVFFFSPQKKSLKRFLTNPVHDNPFNYRFMYGKTTKRHPFYAGTKTILFSS